MFSFQNVTVAFTKLVLIDQTNTPSHYLCNPTRECSKTMADVVHIQIEELRMEIGKRDQELLAMGAKMKTLEEQHQDYQRHIAVLKESLCAKEEHYNMLQTDVRHFASFHFFKNIRMGVHLNFVPPFVSACPGGRIETATRRKESDH